MTQNEHASILAQALPYIQKYAGKTIVIKYGGNAMVNEELKAAVISDIVLLSCIGINVIIVHGGGPEIDEMLQKIGKQTRFVDGLRYTDEETMDIVQMVLCGKVNKSIVSLINDASGKAIGLSGQDSGLLKAKKLKENKTDYGFVGEIYSVNTTLLNDITEKGYIPVVATVACGKNGKLYNVNADTAAAKIAASVKAERLLLLTDVAGVLRNPSDNKSIIDVIHVSEVMNLVKEGIITGGMKPKIDCCVLAVREGVKRATIIDGRVPHSVLIEVLSDKGSGTMIY